MSLSVLLVPLALSTTLTAISSIAAALNNINSSVDSELKEKESEKTSKINYEVIETDMKDLELLNKSVEYFKYDIKIGEKTTELQSDLVFFINENGNFSVMYNKKKKSEYLPVISEIREEYGKKVQEQVYENVLKNHKEQGFILENEVIEEDDSITLTFDTGDR